MKRIYFVLLLLVSLTSLTAQTPSLVGHRGSIWGLENSKESFENGAQMGYLNLESDIRVTLDSQFVLCHDEDLSRFGYPDVKIAETTLSDLRLIVLEQMRGEVNYEGIICTLHEYLMICHEFSCAPVMELKWTTGINQKDCSLIPKLLAEVDSAHLQVAPIFLSSMKACLETIRSLRPEASVQLLTYDTRVASELDWCVAHHIDVDVRKGEELTPAVVDVFHQAGLKVNVWTINQKSEYDHYVTLSVDFITTDFLELEK